MIRLLDSTILNLGSEETKAAPSEKTRMHHWNKKRKEKVIQIDPKNDMDCERSKSAHIHCCSIFPLIAILADWTGTL